jgi:hypothetical protein
MLALHITAVGTITTAGGRQVVGLQVDEDTGEIGFVVLTPAQRRALSAALEQAAAFAEHP